MDVLNHYIFKGTNEPLKIFYGSIKMSEPKGNMPTYHIMAEVLTLAGAMYYVYTQNSKLSTRISLLESRLAMLEQRFIRPTSLYGSSNGSFTTPIDNGSSNGSFTTLIDNGSSNGVDCSGGMCEYRPKSSLKNKSVTFESMVQEVEYEGGNVKHNIMVPSPSTKIIGSNMVNGEGGVAPLDENPDKNLSQLIAKSIRPKLKLNNEQDH